MNAIGPFLREDTHILWLLENFPPCYFTSVSYLGLFSPFPASDRVRTGHKRRGAYVGRSLGSVLS